MDGDGDSGDEMFHSKPFGLDDDIDDPLSASPMQNPRSTVSMNFNTSTNISGGASIGSNDSFDQFLKNDGVGNNNNNNNKNNNDEDDNNQSTNMMNASFNMNFNDLTGGGGGSGSNHNSSSSKNGGGLLTLQDSTSSADNLLQAALNKSTDSFQVEDNDMQAVMDHNGTTGGGGGGHGGNSSSMDHTNINPMMNHNHNPMGGSGGGGGGMMSSGGGGIGMGGGGGGGGLSRIPSFHPVDDPHQSTAWSPAAGMGGGGGGGGNNSNATFSNATFGAKPLNISMNSIASTLRNKKAQQQSKTGRLQATKASMTSATLRSTMSDGMLARALKARYNTPGGGGGGGGGGRNLSSHRLMAAAGGGGSSNADNMASRLGSHASSRAALLNKLQNAGAITASRANNLGQLGNANNTDQSRNRLDMMMMNLGGGGGGNGGGGGGHNAQWGAPPAKRSPSSASIFSNMLQSSAKNSLLGGQQPNQLPRKGSRLTMSSASSTSSLLKHAAATAAARKSGGGGSGGGGIGGSTSITDLLRMSKTQTKTQSMLRQSSAQSLLKQTSSQNLRVDVSSLLPGNGIQNNAAFRGPSASNATAGGISSSTPAPSMTTNSGNVMDDSSMLHQSCRLYPTMTAIVESALGLDPEAIRRRVPVVSNTESSALQKPQGMGMMLPNKLQRKTQEIYAYPINIAIKHGGSMPVLQLLVQAGPDVLVMKDGNDSSGSLSIALTTKHCDLNLIQLLVTANPECVSIADRRANYPLHIAASNGCSLDIVKRIHSIFPRALQMRNFHSQTPLDIAQRSTVCPEEVMNFLSSAAYHKLEHTAYHLDHHQNDTPTQGGCGSGGGGNAGNMGGVVGGGRGGSMGQGIGGGGGGGGVIFEDSLDDIMETNL